MPSELSPTARALRALEILQVRPVTSAHHLAERLGVTERAARRYVGILREAGIPIESTRGPHGGYRVRRGARLPPIVFTQNEALGLVMAVLDAQAGDLVGAALDRVIRALPEDVGRQAAMLAEHAAAAPDRRWSRADPATTSALVAAAATRRRVVLTYRTGAGREWESTVDPWAVVTRHGRWYLLCYSHHAAATRTYRIDRVLAVVETQEEFQAPDVDPVAVLEENLGTGWEFRTRVVFDAPLAEVAAWVRPTMGRLEPAGRGCVLVGSTSNPSMYAQEYLAPLPFDFHVEEGEELRAAVAAVATRFTAAARRQPGTPARDGGTPRRGA